jgi:hypothetical protein
MKRPPPVLLGAPYHPPALRRGDRAVCLFRDADVVVTSWTAAPPLAPLPAGRGHRRWLGPAGR